MAFLLSVEEMSSKGSFTFLSLLSVGNKWGGGKKCLKKESKKMRERKERIGKRQGVREGGVNRWWDWSAPGLVFNFR